MVCLGTFQLLSNFGYTFALSKISSAYNWNTSFVILHVVNLNSRLPLLQYKITFLARQDECPESYCRTPGVGISVRVCLRVHKKL